jgi:hypothetical protein
MIQSRSRAAVHTNHREALAAHHVPVDGARPEGREELSSEELVQVLSLGGANILAHQEHGVMLAARRRLIFIRRAWVVERIELRDALEAAGIGPGRYDRLLAAVRGQATIENETAS